MGLDKITVRARQFVLRVCLSVAIFILFVVDKKSFLRPFIVVFNVFMALVPGLV